MQHDVGRHFPLSPLCRFCRLSDDHHRYKWASLCLPTLLLRAWMPSSCSCHCRLLDFFECQLLVTTKFNAWPHTKVSVQQNQRRLNTHLKRGSSRSFNAFLFFAINCHIIITESINVNLRIQCALAGRWAKRVVKVRLRYMVHKHYVALIVIFQPMSRFDESIPILAAFSSNPSICPVTEPIMINLGVQFVYTIASHSRQKALLYSSRKHYTAQLISDRSALALSSLWHAQKACPQNSRLRSSLNTPYRVTRKKIACYQTGCISGDHET